MPLPPISYRARQALAAGLVALYLGVAPAAAEIRILVQSSALAGSQYYVTDELLANLRVGDALTLVREAENAHDKNAIRVEWKGIKLGYVPRAENRSLASALDAGEVLVARIKRLQPHRNPWKRVEFEVFVRL